MDRMCRISSVLALLLLLTAPAFSQLVPFGFWKGTPPPVVPPVSDVIPPAPIEDFSVAAVGTSSVTLAWSAVGNDSLVGVADAYDMRFSTLPFATDNVVVNGSFARNASGFTTYDASISRRTDTVHSAGGSALVSGTSEWSAIGWTFSCPQRTDTVFLSAWVYVTTADTLSLEFTRETGAAFRATYKAVHIAAGSWTQLRDTLVLPGTQSSVTGWVQLANAVTARRFFVDDITMHLSGASWASGTVITNPPSPGSTGTSEQLVVNGLSSGETYWFGMKASDWRNSGRLVAVVRGTTEDESDLGPPRIFTSGDKYVSKTGSRSNAGTLAAPWNMETACDSAGSRPGLDTLLFLSNGGTYTVPLTPRYSGTSEHPIVFANYSTNVCSLQVSGNEVIDIDGTDYIQIKGFRGRLVPNSGTNVVHVNKSDHVWIDLCRFYGGSSFNGSTWDDQSIRIDSSEYGRITRTYLDRLDTAITADENRGEGIALNPGTRFFILERDTAVHVSHFAIKVEHGAWGGDVLASALPNFNIVRNCVAHDNHVNFGGTDLSWWVMFERNKGWSPGGANTYRDGINLEWVARYGIDRLNMWANDSSTANHGSSLWNEYNASTSVQSWAASSYGGRHYRNAYLGRRSPSTARPMGCLETLYDTESAGDTLGNEVFKNNILAYPAPVSSYDRTRYERKYCFLWQGLVLPDSFITNLLWTGTPGDTLAGCDDSGVRYKIGGLTGTIHNMFFSGNMEASPGFIDSTSERASRQYDVAANSPVIDAAAQLTNAVSGSNYTSTKQIPVYDALYFHGKWSPYDRGDSVTFVYVYSGDTVYVPAEIDSVSYPNNRLYLVDPVTVRGGAKVHLRGTYNTVTGTYTNCMSGKAPDIGPFEYQGEGGGGEVYAATHPRTFMNRDQLEALKAASGSLFDSSYNALVDNKIDGEDYMGMSIPSVVDSSPDTTWDSQTYGVHDYWTDQPSSPGADRTDYSAVQQMCDMVRDLAVMHAITGTSSYADRALEILKAWCVTTSTRMNASGALHHYQSRIELWASLPGMVYGMDLLYDYSGWSTSDRSAEFRWIDTLATETLLPDYLDYSPNNWRIWGTQFLAAAGGLLENDAYLDSAWHYYDRILKDQVLGESSDSAGLMPLEVARANSLGYSLYGLEAMIGVAQIAENLGKSTLWTRRGPDNQSLQSAMDALVPYLLDPDTWPYPQTPTFDAAQARDNGYQMFEFALKHFPEKYQYNQVLDLYGRPAYEIRTAGPITLTHRAPYTD
jgi:hypothetical protein